MAQDGVLRRAQALTFFLCQRGGLQVDLCVYLVELFGILILGCLGVDLRFLRLQKKGQDYIVGSK